MSEQALWILGSIAAVAIAVKVFDRLWPQKINGYPCGDHTARIVRLEVVVESIPRIEKKLDRLIEERHGT